MSEFTKVTLHGREQDYDAVANMMDDEIREELHAEMWVESPTAADNQKFLDAYLIAHEAKHGEVFDIN